MKKVLLLCTIALASFSVHAETFESGRQFSEGNFWSITGTNPDSSSCRYIQTVRTPAQCSSITARQGYSRYKIANAKYSYKSFSHGKFGSYDVIACFGCMN